MPCINPDRWRVLSAYLDDALEIAIDDRGAWLAALGAIDQELADELKIMLAEHEILQQSRFLECGCRLPSRRFDVYR